MHTLRTELVKLAFQSINQWSQNHPWKSMAVGALPGVGTAMFGNNAIADFRQGRMWSGLGNTAAAGLSLLGGGGIAKGVGSGLKSMFPTAGKAMSGMGSAMPNLSKGFGAAKGMMTKIPGISQISNFAQRRPIATGAALTGGQMGAFNMQGARDSAQSMSQQQGTNIANWLQTFRDPGMQNPIWARPADAAGWQVT